MAITQLTTLQKRVCIWAALLAAVVALLGGLLGQLQFALLLLRALLSALGFSLLIGLLLATAQRRLPELFTLSSEPTSLPSEVDSTFPLPHEPPEEEEVSVSPLQIEEVSLPIGSSKASPSLIKQIVEQYTPEQLSRAVRTALDNK